MKEQTILDGNKLIAEFMGAVSTQEDHTDYNEDGTIKYTPNEDGSKWFITTWSKPNGVTDEMYKRWGWGDYTMGKWYYYTSWEWLMPVVEQIESMGGDIIIYFACCDLNYKKGEFKIQRHNTDGDKKILATWRAVVDFIKWYNTNKK